MAFSGFSGGFMQQMLPQQQDKLWRSHGVRVASGPAPRDNSPAGLTQRYGNIPETFDQLATMNGWNQSQGSAPAPGPAPGPAAPGPAAPGGSPAGAPVGGGGGSLADLRAQIMGYDPTAGINQAYELTKKQGLQSLGMDVEDNLAARGVTTGSATGQDLQSRLTAQLLGPLQAQHAQALANAQADRLSRLTGLTGMELDQARAQQEADYRRQRDAADEAYRRDQLGIQQKQFEQAQQAAANQLEWQKTQQTWATEDRKREEEGRVQAALRQGLLGGGGSGGGAMGSVATGSGLTGQEAYDRAFGTGPTTPTGHAMGGGAGLGGLTDNGGFGEKFGGFTGGHKWDGVDRSSQPRPFEGASTTTVGSSQNGPITTGSGTMVGSGAPFSGAPTTWGSVKAQAPGTGATSGLLGAKPAANKPNYAPAGNAAGYPQVRRT